MDKTDSKKKQFFLSKEREQDILRKLENSHIRTQEEYRKIVHNLEQQNVRLREELKTTGEKVLKLLEKKKFKPTESNHAIENEILARKSELDLKYKQFDQFKRDVQDAMSKKEDPEIRGQSHRIDSETKLIDKEIKALREERRLLETSNRDLTLALAEFTKDEFPDKDRLETLQKQNRQLRRKATEERKKDDDMDHESIKVQQSLVALQQKIRRSEQVKQREIPKNLKSLKTLQLSDRSEIVMTTLAKEVLDLKAKKNELIDHEQQLKNQLTRKKHTLYEGNQQLWDRSKKLEADKVMLLQECNKYEAFLNSRQSQGRKVKQPLKHQQSQTEQTAQLFRLRRDYAGTFGRYRFDDRTAVLLNRFNTKIFKIVAYETEKGALVAAKFFYFNGDAPNETFEGSLAVPAPVIQKCRQRLGQLKPPNFFKLFKIKTSGTERRILKLQMVSNASEKFEFGEKRSFEQLEREEAVYSFDINTTEYPASMFGSAFPATNQEWYMESLGTEVRDSKEELD